MASVAAVLVVLCVALAPSATAEHDILELVSMNEQGQATKHSFFYLSADGGRVLYGNQNNDIYERVGATRRLVVPPGATDGPNYAGASADGAHVVFEHRERLTSEDTDDQNDLYEYTAGVTRLVSIGPAGGNGPIHVCAETPHGADSTCPTVVSGDGSHILFYTEESLVPEDTDSHRDLYDRGGGVTSLVSTGPAGGNDPVDQPVGVHVPVISHDGSRVFFDTPERLVSEDTDSTMDVYERFAGTTRLVSTGPTRNSCTSCGSELPWRVTPTSSSDRSAAVTPDGLTVHFTSNEQLVAGAPAGSVIYRRKGGETTIVSRDAADNPITAGWQGGSVDGERIYFRTGGEIYVRAGDTTTSVTGPRGPCEVAGEPAWPCNGPDFLSESHDGSRVFFSASYTYTADDWDACADPHFEDPDRPCIDIYERSGGTTKLVSTGPVDTRQLDVRFGGISADGTRVFFETYERLSPDDVDEFAFDVYERADGATSLLVSGAHHPHFPGVSFNAVSPDGRMVLVDTWNPLIGGDTNSSYDLYAVHLSGPGYARPRGATPTYVPLVLAYQECTAPDRQHAPPLAHDSCSSPDQVSTHLTVGTFDANGQPAKSIGTVRYGAASGTPATPADEADVRFYLRLGDVRRASDLSDYEGELELRTAVRLTDRRSGPGADEPATVEDFDFPVAVPCAATADTTIGAHCEVATSAEAITPGAVTEGARSLWELAQPRVYDGGPDGLAATQDNTVFAVQGVFIP